MRTLSLTAVLCLAIACGEKEPVDSAADADGDGYTELDDCDDDNADVNPGATEICDEIDNNCDGVVDEGVTITVYGDQDGDGVGVTAHPMEACAAGEGQSELDGDCDDSNPAVYPGAPEEDCTDPVDYNCDGVTEYEDGDGDGYAACVDCDDASSAIHPDADEVCDTVDNDCDGLVDDDSALDAETFYADTDGDGYGDASVTAVACFDPPSGYVDDNTDCDDASDSVHPGAAEICDGLDTDCDGAVGELLVPTDYSTLQAAVDAGEGEICLEAGTYSGATVITMAAPLTIEGVGSDQVFLDGGDADAVLTITGSDDDLWLSGFTVQNGWSDSGYAAGLYYTGTGVGSVTLDDLMFTGNECGATTCFGAALTLETYNHVEVTDLEVTGNTISGVPYGSATFLNGESLTLDGVSIHDEVTDTTGTNTGQASALHVQSTSITDNTTGYYSAVVSVNDLQLYDNSATSAGTIYSAATFYGLGTLDITNSSFTGNSLTPGGFCTVPALFPFIVYDGAYNNVEIVGNDCTAGTDVYAAGFWHYGLSGLGTASVENMIVAGNTATAGNRVWAGFIFDYYADITYTNVSVHGNTASGVYNYSGWLQYSGNSTTLNNVDYSGNSLTTTSGSSYATGFGTASGPIDITYSNLIDLGDTPFDSSLTDPTGTNGVISVDPGYTDVSDADPLNWDLTLSSTSDLIDAGDPSLSDSDGTTSDIGAWGGPGAADW